MDGEVHAMQRMLVVLALILAACQPSGEVPSAERIGEQRGTPVEAAAEDPAAACEAMEQVASRSPRVSRSRVASALSITGDTASSGNDSNFGIQVARKSAARWPVATWKSSTRTLAVATPPPARRPLRRSWPTPPIVGGHRHDLLANRDPGHAGARGSGPDHDLAVEHGARR